MSCKCQECGRQYKVDILVPDDIWELIKPKGKPKGGGLLCGPCIAEKLENAFGGYDYWHLMKYSQAEMNQMFSEQLEKKTK